MEEQIEAILKFHMPRWNELPDKDLYLDQVVNYIEKYFKENKTSRKLVLTKF